MKRNMLNFLIDAVSAGVMLGMIATGLVIRFVLPPGSGSRRLLWGLGRHDWGDVHFWLAVAVGVAVVVHIALHWQWVCVTTLRFVPGREGRATPGALRRNTGGIALLLLLAGLFGGFVWVASRSVTDVPADASIGPATGGTIHEGDGGIQGSMTLGELADALGIDVQAVRSRLDLPEAVSDDARLGRLAKEYGFTMQRARQRLAEQSLPGEERGKH